MELQAELMTKFNEDWFRRSTTRYKHHSNVFIMYMRTQVKLLTDPWSMEKYGTVLLARKTYSNIQLIMTTAIFIFACHTCSCWFWVARESISSLWLSESLLISWLCSCFSSSMWTFISSIRWCRLSASCRKKDVLSFGSAI